MGGAAPAIDNTHGTVFLTAGNGSFNGSAEWGETVLQLHSGIPSSVDDWYTPNDYAQLNSSGNVCQSTSCPPGATQSLAADNDLGSGGVVLLSTQSFTLTNHELLAAGKEGMIYVTWYGTGDPASGYKQIMGGLDGGSSCGYSNPGCAVTPAANDCTTSGAPTSGYIAQCWEAFKFSSLNGDNNGSRGSPAFIDGGSSSNYLYVAGIRDNLKAF